MKKGDVQTSLSCFVKIREYSRCLRKDIIDEYAAQAGYSRRME